MAKLNSKYLKSNYKTLWKSVEEMVFEDIRLAKKTDKFSMLENTAHRIAYNAAFIATSTIDIMLKK